VTHRTRTAAQAQRDARSLRTAAQAQRDARILRTAAQFDSNAPEAFNASALDDTALSAEYERIRTRGQELAATDTLDDAGTAELSGLAARLPLVQAELSARETAAQERQAQRDAFASLEPLSAPQSAPEPVAAPTPAPTPAPAPVIEPTAVQASTEAAPTPVVPSVAEMSEAPVPAPPATTVRAFVSADAAGHIAKRAGDEFDGVTEISHAMLSSFQQYGRAGGGGRSARHAVAQFKRERDSRLVVDDPKDGPRVLAYARDETRLPGGSLAQAQQQLLDQGAASLTAAAGWCAPSENDYDLCRQWSAGVGLLDLPTVTVTRGGVNYTDEINFATIYAAAIASGITYLTEAEVIADEPKTCLELPCPEFEDVRLAVQAACVRVSFLQAVGYPEVVNAWTDGVLAVNEQEMNRRIIAAILARAGAATVVTPPPSGPDSFTSALLAAVELAATDTRAQFMMAPNATVEIVHPWWVLPQMRADLSRRMGVDLLSVDDAMINRMFSVRNVRPQFVRGWQDGLITGGALDPAFPGGAAATPFMTALPSDVSFLAFPAGSVAVGRQDVVTLTNVYDAASITQNLFTSIFAAVGFAVLFPCQGQRLYPVEDLCTMGVTGAANLSCTAPAP
jgi:hypothetical protein